MLLDIDVGTTHCKAGLFESDGRVVRVVALPTPAQQSAAGNYFYEPEQLWQSVWTAMREALGDVELRRLSGIGVASMAESGLLLDRKTGEPRIAETIQPDPARHAIYAELFEHKYLRWRESVT